MESNNKGFRVVTHQKRYGGTDYEVYNIPKGMTREEIIKKASGFDDGWWVSGWSFGLNSARFNIDFD